MPSFPTQIRRNSGWQQVILVSKVLCCFFKVDDTGNIHVELIPPEPQVWFLDRAFEWHFLAPNFPTYFRMMLVHLGLPQWQMRFTSMGPSPGALQLMTLLAPHLLNDKGEKEDEHYPVQVIDPAVFKIRNRGRKSAEKTRPSEKF